MKLKDILEKRVKELNISYYKLSKMANVSLSTLYDLKNDRREEFTLRNTIKVFNALRLDLNELREIKWENSKNDQS